MAKKKTEYEYLLAFKEVYGDKYRYLPFPLTFNQHTNIGIVCQKHGVFFQRIGNHLNNRCECPKCSKERVAKERIEGNFEQRKKQIIDAYSNVFDFSNTDFNKSYNDKIKVICKDCGKESEKLVGLLLNRIKDNGYGNGCPFCRIPRMEKTFYQNLRDAGKIKFLERMNEKFPEYDFSEIDYQRK